MTTRRVAYFALLALLIAALVVYVRRRAAGELIVDYPVMWLAGRYALWGRTPYGIPEFVYPPFAAMTFAALGLFPMELASQIYAYVQVVLPVASVGVLAGALARRFRCLLGLLAAIAMIKSDMLVDALFLGNPSLLFVLPLTLVILAWGTGRWTMGAVILGLSLAVKPLLIALVLFPLVRRDLRTCLTVSLSAVVPTLLALAVFRDLPGLFALPARILSGTNLHGDLQALNLSVTAMSAVYPAWAFLIQAVRLVLASMVVGLVWRARHWPPSPSGVAVVCGGLAIAPAVLGSLNEVHYLVLTAPALVVLTLGRNGRVAQAAALTAGVVLCFPLAYLGQPPLSKEDAQLRWAPACALALIAACFGNSSSEPEVCEIARLEREDGSMRDIVELENAERREVTIP